MTVLKVSPHGSFIVTKLGDSVVICEDINDQKKWGNRTETKPGFMVYLGCQKSEALEYINRFRTFYKCQWCEVRNPKYLTDFEVEIKIKGMRRTASVSALGLDYLVESEEEKQLGANYDEYNYYCDGYIPRW